MRKIGRLIVLPLLLFSLLGCSRKEVPEDRRENQSGGRLVCAAETVEEARQIAQLYGIEFVDLQYGLACFSTEEDPNAVIERGKAQGWPELVVEPVAHMS